MIYLDYNATTPVDKRVFEAMRPFFLEDFGNAGSRTHVFGQRAQEAVNLARLQVASLIGAKPGEIIFTSGATESNNLVLLGLARWGERNGKKHIVSTQIEHKSVLEPISWLGKNGFEIDLSPVGREGIVDPEDIRKSIRKDTLLVSVMHSNNETGVIQPVKDIATLLERLGVYFHVDAAQTFGKEIGALRGLACDYMSISAHKIYGPKGVGVLYARRSEIRGRLITPLFFGGGQEMGIRPGTVPVPLVAGLGKAAELAGAESGLRNTQAIAVREALLNALKTVDYRINGDLNRIQSHVLNICFPGVDSEALMFGLYDKIAISSGSACTSDKHEVSHVLKSMGFSLDEINSSVRISWGAGVKVENVPINTLVDMVRKLRT